MSEPRATEPRPGLTGEIKRVAATTVVDRMIKAGLIEAQDRDESINDIARVGGAWHDGYQIARELEKRFGWDCNMEIAEGLDGFAGMVGDEIEASQKDWAARNNIQPPLPLGARIRARAWGLGTITEIYERGPAQYIIEPDDRPGVNAIVNFEDAVADTSALPLPVHGTPPHG